MTDRKKTGVVVWILIVALAAAIVYPVSFGPACWICSRISDGSALWEMADFVYAPILWAWYDAPAPVNHVIEWYANLGAAGGLNVAKMLDGSFCVFPLHM